MQEFDFRKMKTGMKHEAEVHGSGNDNRENCAGTNLLGTLR